MNKQPFRTAAPQPKSFPWMRVCVWKVFSLGSWDTVLDVLEPFAQGDFMRERKQKQNVKRETVSWAR